MSELFAISGEDFLRDTKFFGKDYRGIEGVIKQPRFIDLEHLNDPDMHKPGIWVLFGQRNITEKFPRSEKSLEPGMWTCLQIGKTKNVAWEIARDVRILNEPEYELEQDYINQWGEAVFKHPTHIGSSAGLWAYTDIPGKFENLVFYLICDKNVLAVEKACAELWKPLYWRNGGGNRRKYE